MTKKEADEQIEIIKKITAEALKSKESARQFLIDAGIIEQDSTQISNQSGVSSTISDYRFS